MCLQQDSTCEGTLLLENELGCSSQTNFDIMSVLLWCTCTETPAVMSNLVH